MKLRLALRREGPMWNAYLARMDTMDDARLIGSISIGAVVNSGEIKAEFQALMQKVLVTAIKEVTGMDPGELETRPAPESERAGNA